MAAFSSQHHQSLYLDHAYLPTYSIHIATASNQPGDLTNIASPFFPCYYSPDSVSEISTNDMRVRETSSSLDTATMVTSGDHHQRKYCTSVAVEQIQLGEEVRTKQKSMEKKRNSSKQMITSSSALPPNDSREGKRRKQRKFISGLKEVGKASKSDGGEEKQTQQEPPAGYIHVRARRGQATDSHSLAERVRREKISERMKLLQGLVPGCEKVIGKALMLDEIINYVQSLQNQVEFLSMKLASVNPTLYEFGLDMEDYTVQAQKMEDMSPLPSVQQTAHIQPAAFVETTSRYPMMDTSAPFLLPGQGPSAYPQEQECFVMEVDERSQNFTHQFQLNNICSFQ